MRLTPREYVGRALAILETSLASQVTLTGAHRQLKPSALDAQGLLGALLDQQGTIFPSEFSRRDARTYIHELKATRNKWAHSDPLTYDDAYRASDTVGRLLALVAASPVKADLLKRELRAIELEHECEGGAIPPPAVESVSVSTIAVVACGKQKQVTAAAAVELYTGPLVRRSIERARAEGLPIYILSTRYGLVESASVLQPYELSIEAMTATERREWQDHLETQFAPLCGQGLRRVLTFAGISYRNAVAGALKNTPVLVESHAAWPAICRETFG